MSDIHLQLDRLAVGYRGKALINGMEIGMRRGEIVTLVGPNGSGKSTILKTITKQLVPVEGDVLLADGDGNGSQMRRLSQLTPAELAQKMAVVLTGRLQTELMTCREVVSMGRYPYTGRLGILSDADEQKVDEALAIVHASELSERPFDAVSDGERQRILLARAICQEPEIIVLDEPTSYLDIRHKLELLSILYRMARGQGITVVMSLHEIDLAGKISDRVICVRGGEIYACGTPSEVFREQTVRELFDLDPALGRFDVDRGSLELSFTDGRGLNTTAYYHQAENQVEWITEFYNNSSDNTALTYQMTYPINCVNYEKTGINLRYQYLFSPQFSAMAEGEAYYYDADAFYMTDSRIINGQKYISIPTYLKVSHVIDARYNTIVVRDNYGWGGRFALSADLFLNRKHTWMVSGRYDHWLKDYQGMTRYDGYGYFSFTVRCSLLRDRLKLSLTATDPFSQYVVNGYRTYTSEGGFTPFTSKLFDETFRTNHHITSLSLTATYSLFNRTKIHYTK